MTTDDKPPCQPDCGSCTRCDRVALFPSKTCGCECHRTHLVMTGDPPKYADIDTLTLDERIARLRNLAIDAGPADATREFILQNGGSVEWHVGQVTKQLHRELPPRFVLALLDRVQQLEAALTEACDVAAEWISLRPPGIDTIADLASSDIDRLRALATGGRK